MQFQRLRLVGFKSFVDPAEVHIESGLTGIVGPNGCGKSNVLESLRWVMGANSAKAMRGQGMDDVIFEEFKGTGNAEIVLDRDLSEKRIYPAINIRRSGTRNEERLVNPDIATQRNLLLRALNSRFPDEAMQALIKQLHSSPTNEQMLVELIPE